MWFNMGISYQQFVINVTDDHRLVVWYWNGSCDQTAVRVFSNIHICIPVEILYRLAAVVFR